MLCPLIFTHADIIVLLFLKMIVDGVILLFVTFCMNDFDGQSNQGESSSNDRVKAFVKTITIKTNKLTAEDNNLKYDF